jgi:hypothetical protein
VYSPLSFLFNQAILLNKPRFTLHCVINCGHMGPYALNDPLYLPDDLLPSPLVLVDPLTELPLLPDHVVHRLLQHPVEPQHPLVVPQLQSLHSHLPVSLQVTPQFIHWTCAQFS